MTLKEWIIKTGPKKAAQLLGVDPATVSYWRTGGVAPRPRYMVKIVKLSGGKVTFEHMVRTAAKNQERLNAQK